MTDIRWRNGAARRRVRARVLREEHICHLCGMPVDKTLTKLWGSHGPRCADPGCPGCTPHPMAPEIDEIVPVSRGGSPYDRANCRLSHRRCNNAAGDKTWTPAPTTGQSMRSFPVSDAWGSLTMGLPSGGAADGRTVVLLCGPPGAGKTTAAHASGLTVYDQDDYASPGEFTRALRELRGDGSAQAVVIRSAPSSADRTRVRAQINATHTRLLIGPRDELASRIVRRGRHDAQRSLAGLGKWFGAFDARDRVQLFDGWQFLYS